MGLLLLFGSGAPAAVYSWANYYYDQDASELKVFKNVASQSVTLFAFDSATGAPKTGDAANITAYVSQNDGSVTALTDTSAAETDATNAKGDYLFTLTQAETNADKLRFSAKSATANIVIVPITVYTLPATGILAPTTSGRTLDVSAGGEAGIDWANVGSPTTVVGLTNTTVGIVSLVTTVTTLTNLPAITAGWLTATGIASDAFTAAKFAADCLTAAKIADGAIDAATFAAGAIDATAIAANAITDAKVASDVTIASVTGAVGSVTTVSSGAISEASFATTDGTFAPLQVVDQGTGQSATSTTVVLRAASNFNNTDIVGNRILITAGTGVGQSRLITAYVSSTDTVTVAAWTTTPSGFTYKIFSDTAAASGSAPSAADVADAVWDELLSGHTTSGSAGAALTTASTNVINATVATGAAETTLTAYLNETKTFTITTEDADGNAVDLSALTLQVVIEDAVSGTDIQTIANASITKTSTTISFATASTTNDVVGVNYRWACRRTDTNEVKLFGPYVVKVAADD